MKFKFGIIGCGSIARDHAAIIKKLGHQVVLGITKSKNSKNWKLFKKIFPEAKFANNFASPIYPILADIYLLEGDLKRAKKVCEIGLDHNPHNIDGKYI